LHKHLEQWTNTQFCVKLGNTASGTCAMLSEAYGGETMKTLNVFKWHIQLKESSNVEITN